MKMTMRSSVSTLSLYIVAATSLLGSSAALAGGKTPFPASARAAELDQQIDWTKARLIAVQDGGRYKALDSFARESMAAMHGAEHFPGLSPMASMFEWIFNRNAYADEPVIYVKDRGLRIHFTAHMAAMEREFIRDKKFMTLRQFSDAKVRERMNELEPRFEMVAAMRRVRNAQAIAMALDQLINIVPPGVSDPEHRWHPPQDLLENLTPEQLQAMGVSGERDPTKKVSGISPDQALAVLAPWATLQQAWRAGDVAKVQESLDRLHDVLPTITSDAVYPKQSQLAAEAHYYAMGKFTWGWALYFLAMIASIWALVTNWRVPWIAAVVMLVVAMLQHAYGLGVRWYILDRIPVANMFEAVVASAWIGIVCALLAEMRYRTRVFLFGASTTGFLALILAQFVIPGGGTLTTIMGILDDVMLRIHTVLIIASYALIFLASVIAIVYLFAYYFLTHAFKSLQFGIATSLIGGLLLAAIPLVFRTPVTGPVDYVKLYGVSQGFAASCVALCIVLTWFIIQRAPGIWMAMTSLLIVGTFSASVGDRMFYQFMGYGMAGLGLGWTLFVGVGLLLQRWQLTSVPEPLLAVAGGGSLPLRYQRPTMAGGAPGDEHSIQKLPTWLHQMDWSHLIILNLVFVMLFVGIILGAIWADYSWGRPWGWDPKEVFAMNTWIIYAVLIHVRFIAKKRGLWTAWLSVAGCAMMAFNWCFVNFFIVGLHSYA